MSHHYYKLLDWIPLEKLDWPLLSKNPAAIHHLEQNKDKINCPAWSPTAFQLISNNTCAFIFLFYRLINEAAKFLASTSLSKYSSNVGFSIKGILAMVLSITSVISRKPNRFFKNP